MKLDGKVVVVTGAAHGIGKALAERLSKEDLAGLAVIDIAGDKAKALGDRIGARSFEVDVSDEDALKTALDTVARDLGPVDLLCSNAGIAIGGGPEVPDEDWDRIWRINVMSHIYCARAVVPSMLERGGGYLLHTVSAAGLLSNIGALPYSVTKHAALAFAEWMRITYGHLGLRVSCLCPQGVETRMLENSGPLLPLLKPNAMTAEAVADTAMHGIDEEKFLILPHPEVAHFFERKAADYDQWIIAMQKLQAGIRFKPDWPDLG